jgi:ElaB/YqjD/DUF883 family membrane-anchored ribosome-binding protein
MSNVANPSRPANENNENNAGKVASAVSEKANEAGTFLADKANEAGKFVAENAKNLASSAMHSAENAASYMGQCADDTRSSVGGSIKQMGESLRSAAPEDSMMHDAAGSVASTLESAGQYISEHGFDNMAEDMTNMIRRNPIPAVCIAAGIGFLLARASTSSRS